MDFLVTTGDPSGLLPKDRQTVAPEAPPERGLTLRSLTLHKNYDLAALDWLWDRPKTENEIAFASIAMDASGTPPFVFPPADWAQGAYFKLRSGETWEFTLGNGAPLFAERPVKGGVSVAILITEADKGIVQWGNALSQASKEITDNKDILGKLSRLANPGTAAVDLVTDVVAKATGILGNILKANKDDHVGLFLGYFSGNERPWKNLVQESQGARIELHEVGTYASSTPPQ